MRRRYRDPYAYKQLRELWQSEVWACGQKKARDAQTAFLIRPTKMRLKITLLKPRLYDADNAAAGAKPLMDACKNLHLIHDDSPRWLELEIVQQQAPRHRPVTIVELEPA